jgi:hypothetical protein
VERVFTRLLGEGVTVGRTARERVLVVGIGAALYEREDSRQIEFTLIPPNNYYLSCKIEEDDDGRLERTAGCHSPYSP